METHARIFSPTRQRDKVLAGIWRVADPKISLASAAAMFLGASAAGRDGPIEWSWLALTVAGILFLEAAKNASGEIFDWDSGTDQAVAEEDRSPFSGGKRVLVDRLMTRSQTVVMAAIFYALGVAAGLAIVAFREPSVLWLGLGGVFLAYFYHAPPFQLSYRGFGELAVAFAYGPLITCGTYLVQRRAISPEVALLSLPLGLLIAAFLWINEFPDCKADAAAGKRTVVVRLGRKRASRGFVLLVSLAYAILAVLPIVGVPLLAWLGFVGIPHGVGAGWRLLRHREITRDIVPAQAWTLLSFVLMALGAGVGLLLAGR
jgi:1,4-dihydroxy-2-naphthoate polyprenyltransferase